MPKRVKQKRSSDENEIAFQLVQRATQEQEKEQKPTKVTKDEISRVMAALGRKGGKKGGKRRLKTMTPEERSQVALKAAKARWNKEKQED